MNSIKFQSDIMKKLSAGQKVTYTEYEDGRIGLCLGPFMYLLHKAEIFLDLSKLEKQEGLAKYLNKPQKSYKLAATNSLKETKTRTVRKYTADNDAEIYLDITLVKSFDKDVKFENDGSCLGIVRVYTPNSAIVGAIMPVRMNFDG